MLVSTIESSSAPDVPAITTLLSVKSETVAEDNVLSHHQLLIIHHEELQHSYY